MSSGRAQHDQGAHRRRREVRGADASKSRPKRDAGAPTPGGRHFFHRGVCLKKNYGSSSVDPMKNKKLTIVQLNSISFVTVT